MQESLFKNITTKLQNAYNPLSLYLFGSYAWGTPNKDSDLDLLVVVEHSDEKPYKRAIKGIRALRGMGIAKDILVYCQVQPKNVPKCRRKMYHYTTVLVG